MHILIVVYIIKVLLKYRVKYNAKVKVIKVKENFKVFVLETNLNTQVVYSVSKMVIKSNDLYFTRSIYCLL